MNANAAHWHPWDADALCLQLQAVLPELSLELLPSVASTNTLLLERARLAASAGQAPQACLLVAEEQTQGRGRQGRDWRSRAGASLTFSLALPLAPESWDGLSLVVGLALAEALEPLARALVAPIPEPGRRPSLLLKWPNDLWLSDSPGRGRKLGGVLVETIGIGHRRLCVVGVGLNVLPLPDAGLAHGLAALRELDAQATPPSVLARIALPLLQALMLFEREGFAPRALAYRGRDLLLGHPVSTTGVPALQGVAEGVAADGALLLRCAGALQRVVSGEVSVRFQPEDA